MESHEDRKSFEIQRAPREVPAAVKCQLWFGGVINLVGWIFIVTSLIFVRVFAMESEFWFDVAGDTDFVPGQVTGMEETNVEVNNERVYAIDYRYSVGDVDYRGRSYSTGIQLPEAGSVRVEYVNSDPEVSRIEGMRRYRFPSWAMLTMIIPVIGLAIVAFGFRRGRRDLHVLGHGIPVMGTLVDKRATSFVVNNRRVYELTFAFLDRDGTERRGSVKTARPEHGEDDVEERLLYDPATPQRIVLMDALPSSASIDARGRLQSSGFGMVYALGPVLTVVGLLVILSI